MIWVRGDGRFTVTVNHLSPLDARALSGPWRELRRPGGTYQRVVEPAELADVLADVGRVLATPCPWEGDRDG